LGTCANNSACAAKTGEVSYTFFRYGSRICYNFSATGQLISETGARRI
jgi:hypothetical protein